MEANDLIKKNNKKQNSWRKLANFMFEKLRDTN